MYKIIIFILLSFSLCFAQEVLPGANYQEESSTLNEELRKLEIDAKKALNDVEDLSTADVTGTLPTNKGGTGSTAAANAANGVVILDGSGQIPVSSYLTASYGTNGYVKIGTLIIQWGSFSSENSSDTIVTFPTAFTTAVYNVQATKYGTGNDDPSVFYVYSISTSQVVIHNYTGATNTCYWLAVGY